MIVEFTVERILAVLTTVTLVWAVVKDVWTHLIHRVAGFGVLAVGLGYVFLNTLWLESAFFLAAILGSQGGGWRLPILVLAVLLLSNDLGSLPYVIGILYVLAIFEFGWFGGGDAQLAYRLGGFGEELVDSGLPFRRDHFIRICSDVPQARIRRWPQAFSVGFQEFELA